MNGEEERNPLDVVRLVLGVLILVSLLTPNAKSSDSSNLREEEEIRRQKMEARSLTNKLTNDVKQMRETPSRYAYNVSGIGVQTRHASSSQQLKPSRERGFLFLAAL